MLLDKLCPGNYHSGDKSRGGFAVCLQFVPLLRQIQGYPDAVAFALGGGNKGLGQHGDGILLSGQRGQAFCLFAFPLDGHITGGIDAVLGQHIVQSIFGRAAFTAGIDGFAPQILHGLNGIPTLNNVQHTQRIDRQNLYAALCVVIEDGSQIGRNRGNVCGTLGKGRRDLICHGCNRKIIENSG